MEQLKAYQDVGKYSEVLGASSQKQIEMLIVRAKSDIRGAMGAIEHQDVATKCKCISNAHGIVSYLQECLNQNLKNDAETELAQRLKAIFSHLETQLLKANIESDMHTVPDPSGSLKLLQECLVIMSNIQSWWEKVLEQPI